MNKQRHQVTRQLRARPRLYIAAVVAILVGVFVPQAVAGHLLTRLLLAWNAGTCLYLLLAAIMMTRSSEEQMKRRARIEDDGRLVILALVVVTSIASLVAIAGQLAMVRDMHGGLRLAHIALAGITVLSSWAFIQVMFALHYAHDYFAATARGQPAGLLFPGDEQPDYGDFFYFAAVIGTSGQTADVSFVSKPMRRVGSIHCILAFLFNTTVLAFLINIGASLF